MSHPQNAPHHPDNIAAARALIADPDLAARAPRAVRETAWQILSTARTTQPQVAS